MQMSTTSKLHAEPTAVPLTALSVVPTQTGVADPIIKTSETGASALPSCEEASIAGTSKVYYAKNGGVLRAPFQGS